MAIGAVGPPGTSAPSLVGLVAFKVESATVLIPIQGSEGAPAQVKIPAERPGNVKLSSARVMKECTMPIYTCYLHAYKTNVTLSQSTLFISVIFDRDTWTASSKSGRGLYMSCMMFRLACTNNCFLAYPYLSAESHEPIKVTDGDLCTFYLSGSNARNVEWIKIDFGDEINVKKILAIGGVPYAYI